MSKSVNRVKAALTAAGIASEVIELQVSTKSAQDAATALGIEIDRIAKSIIMQGCDSKDLYLFITAGGNRVSPKMATALVGENIERSEAQTIRDRTGFAIGGVSPIGHLSPIKSFLDPRLIDFTTVWAAGGTPRHLLEIRPTELVALSGATVTRFTELPKAQENTAQGDALQALGRA